MVFLGMLKPNEMEERFWPQDEHLIPVYYSHKSFLLTRLQTTMIQCNLHNSPPKSIL